MSAWTQLIEPGPALLILVLALTPQLGYAAPSTSLGNSDQSTEIEYYPVADATGCYYNFEHYDEGDRIITNEPCLNCTCHNRMLMCYLRVCPFTKAIGQDCKVEKKSDQCCPVITCPEVHVQLLPHASTTPSTHLGHPNEYGCTIENLFYADGAKVPSNPNNPCEVCYCIRNKTACIIQDCTLTGKVVEGCRPVYVDGVCCPVRYDCDHPEIETTPRPLLTTTTTTLPPTSAPTDCIYNNEVYADGALVKKDVPCEQCYCMRGDIVCAVQECGPTPLDKVNCTALAPKEGQCCPDTYECENLSEEDLTTLSYYEVPTTLPTVIEDEDRTKAPVPQITLTDDQLSAETEGRVSESTTEFISEESPVTESATIEAITSKITEAVEAVTSKVTEMIETVTSTIIGTEKEATSSPEIVTAGSKLESEATTIEAVVTEKSEQITEKPSEGQLPVTEHEEQTEHGVVVTEGIVQETQTPESEDQKLAVTTREEVEHILPVTTETTKQDVATEFGEPVAHDDIDQEELPHEEDNEVSEGIPTGEQEPGATHAPELDTGDKHTRPIDQTEVEEKPHTTEQSEIEATSTPVEKLPHEDENQIIEGSGVEELEPIGTLAPEPQAVDHGQATEQTEEPEKLFPTTETSVEPEAEVTGTLSTDISVEDHTKISPEDSVTLEPVTPLGTEQPGEKDISTEYCSEEGCQQTIQPLIPVITTAQPESESPLVPEVQTVITEQEQSHADITKQPEEPSVTEESSVTEEFETKLPKEVTTTESTISESVKPSDLLEEEKASEPKETTTTTVQESISEEEKPTEGIPPERPSVTEAVPTTETQKIEVEVPHEEEKPSFDGTEEDGDHVTTEKEEIQFVTEISTAETKKPQSMDHVFETISPDSTSVKPDSEIHETEKSVETQTTELPKSSETVQPDVTTPKPEHPVEEVTELDNKTEVATESITGITEAVSGIPETPVICDSEHGCAPGQEEANEIPNVIESCTKENCAPQEQIPQSEGDKETGIAPESPAPCESEHDCAPTAEKEGIETNKVPEKDTSVECNTENGCPASGSGKEGQIPEIVTESCDSEVGCAVAVTEKEINQTTETSKVDQGSISEPCGDETSCTPIIPGKEGEVPVTEGEEKVKLPESTTTLDEIISNIPQKVTPLDEEGSGQPSTVTEPTEKPEEIEGSGQDIEGSGQKPEDTEHTESSGEVIEGSGQTSTEGVKPEQTTEESVTHAEESTELDTTKATPSLPQEQPERSTEGEQIITVTPTELENEIEPESTLGPQQVEVDESHIPEVTPSAGTQSPESITEGTQTPETFTEQGTQVPEITVHEETESPEQKATGVTKVPQDTATEGEIPGVTEVPASVAPEATEVHEEAATQVPEDTENELYPESTQTPEHIEPEGTRSPYENVPVSTITSKQDETEDTQSPTKDIVTEVPIQIAPEGTQYPETIIPEGTQLPEEVSKITQTFEETSYSTTSGYVVPSGTEIPTEISPETTSKSDHVISETTDSVQQASSESTDVPADVIPQSTEKPQIELEVTNVPEEAAPQTTDIHDVAAGSTQIPEETEGTQSPEEIASQGTETPEEIVPEVTDEIRTQKPEQIYPEGTVPSVHLEGEETETPEGTQIPEQITPESTYVPENIPAEKVTQSPEQVASEGTHAPEQGIPEDTKTTEEEISQSTQYPEISESTHIPENITLETSPAPESKVPDTETTELPEQTQPPKKITSEETQLPEHAATGVPELPETTQAPVQATTESEIEEEEHGIPGEGNCLVDGQTYRNNSVVPPINQCQTSCKCVSSILQCESVSCTPPPNNLQDCMPIFHSPDSCCPIYSCSVPGVTSMESDSHVVETTTVVQEEEKPVTIGIQIIAGDEATEKSSEVSISSEETTTSKHIEEGIGATEITETPNVPVAEPTTSKSIEQETTKPEVSESLPTEKTESETDKLPEIDVETVTKESAVPESQTGTPGAETTDVLTETKEVITTEPSAKPFEEEHPVHDEIENEIYETPIVPEHCGAEGCQVPVLPTEEPQLPEKSVTEQVEGETESTVSIKEEKTTEKYVEPTEETQTGVTEPTKESELSTSKVPTVTEQVITDELSTTGLTIPSEETSTDQKLPESPVTIVTEQPEEASTSETERSKVPEEEGTASESELTKLPESITESQPSDREHIPSETEIPVTETVYGELSTESKETSESATEAISQETKSPEEIAAISDIEEAATSPSILPDSATEIMAETTSPSGKLPEELATEQPVSADKVSPEGELPVKPESTTEIQEPGTKPDIEIGPTEGTPAHDEGSTESQPEIRYPDRVSTAKPEFDVQTTESHETLQTTSPTIEHVTELDVSITPKPIESADHLTTIVEEKTEKTITPIVEITPESTSKQSVEEPVDVTDVAITSVPQKESSPEGEPITETHPTTLPTLEEETATVTKLDKDKISISEFTTISSEIGEVTQPALQEKETEKEGPVTAVTEGGIAIEKEYEGPVTEKEKDITQPEEEEFPTHAPVDKETDAGHIPAVTEKEIVTVAYVTTETSVPETVKPETKPIVPTEKGEEGMYTSPQLTTQAPSNVSELYTSGFEELSTKKSVEGELSTSATAAAPVSTAQPSTSAPSYVPPPVPGHEIPGEQVPEIPDYQSPVDDYEDEDQSPLGPGTCRYGGKVYVSAQQIPRDDPCDFCFCFRSDIICLQQSCPPPIPRCHEEPIRGFCCPRYECPVGMATAVNVTTSTTTTTTTLPPHFLSHAYKGRVTRSGCQIKGRAYQVGAEITSASGPCLHCTCGGDGEMKCDPKACSPEPMLRQMIAAAASRRRR